MFFSKKPRKWKRRYWQDAKKLKVKRYTKILRFRVFRWKGNLMMTYFRWNEAARWPRDNSGGSELRSIYRDSVARDDPREMFALVAARRSGAEKSQMVRKKKKTKKRKTAILRLAIRAVLWSSDGIKATQSCISQNQDYPLVDQNTNLFISFIRLNYRKANTLFEAFV